MNFVHFTAGKDDEGRRIDKIIRHFLDEKSLSSLYKSLRKGLIKLNGKRCSPDAKIFENDDIQIAEFLISNNNDIITNKNQNKAEIKKLPMPVDRNLIIFRNNDLLILNKPYDISVQGGNGKTSLSEMVEKDYEFYHNEKDSLSFKCGPLHRLDRKTSGIIVFSQSLKGAKWFSQAIKNHRTRKFYLGICEGKLAVKQTWEDEILDSEKQKAGFKTVKVIRKTLGNGNVESNLQDSKTAVTHASPVSYGFFFGTEITIVKFEIETGRKHQIRAQSSFHGFPLLGDTAYGGKKIDSKKFSRDFFLHAYELDFPEDEILRPSQNDVNSTQNDGKLPQKIICELPEDFKNFIHRFNADSHR